MFTRLSRSNGKSDEFSFAGFYVFHNSNNSWGGGWLHSTQRIEQEIRIITTVYYLQMNGLDQLWKRKKLK